MGRPVRAEITFIPTESFPPQIRKRVFDTLHDSKTPPFAYVYLPCVAALAFPTSHNLYSSTAVPYTQLSVAPAPPLPLPLAPSHLRHVFQIF